MFFFVARTLARSLIAGRGVLFEKLLLSNRMLPYCDDLDWACFRGLVLGSLGLITFVFSCWALKRIVPFALENTSFHQNLVMVSLAALQMLLLVVYCFFQRSSQLLYCEKYVRGTQIILTCILYGNLAADLLDRKAAFYVCMVPLIFIVFLVMTANVVIMLGEENIDCHHLSWLLMSICCSIVSGR